MTPLCLKKTFKTRDQTKIKKQRKPSDDAWYYQASALQTNFCYKFLFSSPCPSHNNPVNVLEDINKSVWTTVNETTAILSLRDRGVVKLTRPLVSVGTHSILVSFLSIHSVAHSIRHHQSKDTSDELRMSLRLAIKKCRAHSSRSAQRPRNRVRESHSSAN